ncbi:MAG: 3-keto-5-aminohexanoate cleavage protein [Betaproteobacteria bacterium]
MNSIIPAVSRPVIITCAVTGGAPFKPGSQVPVTPEQIAQQSIDAARDGAAIVHIHVRDPITGAAVGDAHLYREVVERIGSSGVDVIVNLTSGFGGRYVPSAANVRVADDTLSTLMLPEARVAHILALRPGLCSLDVATMNFGEGVFMNSPAHLRTMAEAIRSAGIKPEIEVFDAGGMRLAARLIEQGHLLTPAHFQFCLGIEWGMPASREAMAFMLSLLPEGSTWSAFGIGRSQFPMVTASVQLGGHVRVGLEDNLYLDAGVLAPDNAALVRKAATLVQAEGAHVASPAEARAILGLGRDAASQQPDPEAHSTKAPCAQVHS